MNVLEKSFCRLFQTGFRMAYPFLPYREPKILKSVGDIADVILSNGHKSAILITDSYMKESGATENLENSLAANGIQCTVYSKTRPNPTVTNVDEALEMYYANGCECIIAFGGGSAMDCAKAVGARVAYKGKSLERLRGNLRIYRRLPDLFAVPTTAGTGSEVTLTAVITDPERKFKYTMNSFPLIPRYAVLDPEVTYTLPKHLTSTTGMDALVHAVESYIGQSTTKETSQLAKDVVKLVHENILTAYNDPCNYDSRANMLTAAYKAGIAFSKSYVGYIHAVAHSLGGQYNVPHGLANSVLMPIVLEDYGKLVHKRLCELAVYAGIAEETDSDSVGAAKFIARVWELNSAMGIPTTIEGIKEEDIPKMAKHAHKEGNPLYPVPTLKNAKELEKYYYAVADWSK